ncbi:hypothetical protein C7S18_06050 [Ahniella affigens]|uniref:HNH domain-containing protein n=1 Tax=Ahniella affigens TaxID=2021234 RepID=A0A2P1PPL6_9GAMM|nr:hypothetical protein [Ahniella affigens]AVP96787.1 hypothetical protein C7S18_06050 [Ahniella affigens]
MNNFDHYNSRDLPALRQSSRQVKSLLGTLNEFAEHQATAAGYPEGAVVTKTHTYRERSSAAAQRKRTAAFSSGSYPCSGCRVDYLKKLGEGAKSLYQCHHVLPLHDDTEERETKEKDLLVLCANCHQLIHSKLANLKLEKVQKLHRGTSAA